MRSTLLRAGKAVPAGVAVLLQRGAQAAYGLITVLAISRFLSLEDQGWYYTFISLAALYTLVDLGLSVILVPMFAHEFHRAGCRADQLGRSNLGMAVAELLRKSMRWYSLAAIGFCLIAFIGGHIYFRRLPDYRLPWENAWTVLTLSSGGLLLVMPFVSLIEGAGHIKEVAFLRLAQLTAGSIACWGLLIHGEPLWAAVMVPALSTCVTAIWICLRWRPLARLALGFKPYVPLYWRSTVWPVQWRQAIAWISTYATTQIHTPILMQTQGAHIAGQMGFSLTVITMMALLGQSFLVRRIPVMATAAARRDIAAMDQMFRHDVLFYVGALVAAALLLVVLKLGLDGTPYVQRLLPLPQLAGLLAIVFSNQFIVVLGTYLRSFLYEPLTRVYVISTVLLVPGAYWASHISSGALILFLFTITLGFTLPWALRIWSIERRRWRSAHSNSISTH